MEEIGARLRAIRRQRQLSLREVEERSLHFAKEWGNQSYQISAGWLNRLEREGHELTVNKLIVLAFIYNVSPEQLLRSPQPTAVGQLSNPDLTMGPNHPPDDTTLLPTDKGPLQAPFRRAVIGKRDRTLAPMISAGSIVQIDTQRRAIASGKGWTHEFQRPIYFLMTPDAYFCGWCELDEKSEWLTLVPHSMSGVSSRRWRYRTEVENIGRVVAVAISLAR